MGCCSTNIQSDHTAHNTIPISNNAHSTHHDKDSIFLCESICKCSSIQKIINLLKLYAKNDANDSNKISKYLSKSKNQRLTIAAYHHILHCHLNEDNIHSNESDKSFKYIYDQMINQHDLSCDVSKCDVYLRNNRQREIENSISIGLDLFDAMHCYFLHSVDIGYRNTSRINSDDTKETNDSKEDNHFFDSELSKLKSYLSTRRNQLEQIRGSNRFFNNKFMTDYAIPNDDNSDVKQANENEKQSSIDNCLYSFGRHFDYWYDDAPKPRYASLKMEITNNKIFQLDMDKFDEVYKSSQLLLMHSDQLKKMKSHGLRLDHYEFQELRYGSPIQLDNIISLKLYTDYDTLSHNFSKTFRNSDKNGIWGKISKSNQEYWWWGKILSETVNGFGVNMKTSSIEMLYHGTSELYFSKFKASFQSPTSTTTKLAVAAIFAQNNGIILHLGIGETERSKYSKYYLKYFNCSFVSSFPNEDERLFINPPGDIYYYCKIQSIQHMAVNKNYKDLLDGLRAFNEIFDRVLPLKDNLDVTQFLGSDTMLTKLFNLITWSLNIKQDAEEMKYDQFVLNTFQVWADNKKMIQVSVERLKSLGAILNSVGNGRKINADFVSGMLLSTNNGNVGNLLLYDNINIIFKNVETIYCKEIKSISPLYFDLLVPILNRINKTKFSKLREIILWKHRHHSISKNDIDTYRSKYQTKLKEKTGWKMSIGESSLSFRRPSVLNT